MKLKEDSYERCLGFYKFNGRFIKTHVCAPTAAIQNSLSGTVKKNL